MQGDTKISMCIRLLAREWIIVCQTFSCEIGRQDAVLKEEERFGNKIKRMTGVVSSVSPQALHVEDLRKGPGCLPLDEAVRRLFIV
jgi:hypothetical protein